MKKGLGKDAVIILDRWTKREIAKYPCVVKAAEDLGIRPSSIYRAISQRCVAYECYWVYAKYLPDWQPSLKRYARVRGNKCIDKFKVLLEE